MVEVVSVAPAVHIGVPMSQIKTSRYGFIDTIRGIAACLVLLQHSLYQRGILKEVPEGTVSRLIPNWLELGETGIVAFFLVSGFVIPLSLEKTNNFELFWLHRVLRIYPLYATVFVVTALVEGSGVVTRLEIGFLTAFRTSFFYRSILRNKTSSAVSWTLSLEMVWYVSISGLFLISLNTKPNLLVCLALLVSILAQFHVRLAIICQWAGCRCCFAGVWIGLLSSREG